MIILILQLPSGKGEKIINKAGAKTCVLLDRIHSDYQEKLFSPNICQVNLFKELVP
ncbi:hypothetical protein [Marinifilum sp.]|uniref:hypothetical protein n=1 Tax=Marinifilum sp. TaxID=2033137 RepID=UPI003BA9CFFE